MSTTDAPLFTCFTPTYNRAQTLPVVFSSLEAQTFRDFEWLVVDDGSTDDTEAVVRDMASRADFPVRYLRKENGGMHTAINAGVEAARGELFLKCDSDDSFDPDSMERFQAIWLSIPEGERSAFAGVTVHCKDAKGDIVGTRFPAELIDGDSLTMAYRWKVRGEKWGFQRTAVLREFPFPVCPGEKRMPPSLVWNRIALKYRTRYADIALRVFVPLADGITANSARSRARSCRGTMLYYDELTTMPIPFAARFKAAVNYLRFAPRPLAALRTAAHRILTFLALPFGMLARCRDGNHAA